MTPLIMGKGDITKPVMEVQKQSNPWVTHKICNAPVKPWGTALPKEPPNMQWLELVITKFVMKYTSLYRSRTVPQWKDVDATVEGCMGLLWTPNSDWCLLALWWKNLQSAGGQDRPEGRICFCVQVSNSLCSPPFCVSALCGGWTKPDD